MVVVGAGFAGMYLVKLLRDKGFSVQCIERGSDVGGTWYWNRYPGARCDVESMQYSYGWDDELQQDWEWSERFSGQPEILRYASHVADKHDLRSSMVFDTAVETMTFDAAENRWTLTTSREETLQARFCICATGCLSEANKPQQMFSGVDDFIGETFHTGHWPHADRFSGVLEPLEGKRVALIGNGSSGIQSIPEIAKVASELVVFSRTPQYSVPAQNQPMDKDYEAFMKANYKERRALMRANPGGQILHSNNEAVRERLRVGMQTRTLDWSPEEREAQYQALWDEGGFTFYTAFMDAGADPEANAEMAEFIRGKIRDTVTDPEMAALLSPENFVLCKRPVLDSGYFEAFNEPHVKLVPLEGSTSEEPKPGASSIAGITKNGVRMEDSREFEVDVIVFAIGYDAMTGAILNIDVTGEGGAKLADHWVDGPRSYMGLQMAGFPNLLTVTGPGNAALSPSAAPHPSKRLATFRISVRFHKHATHDRAALRVDRGDSFQDAQRRLDKDCHDTTGRGGLDGPFERRARRDSWPPRLLQLVHR